MVVIDAGQTLRKPNQTRPDEDPSTDAWCRNSGIQAKIRPARPVTVGPPSPDTMRCCKALHMHVVLHAHDHANALLIMLVYINACQVVRQITLIALTHGP